MQPEFIAKLIALVQQKGDRVVVTDAATGKAVVILNFGEYERLLGQNDALASAVAIPEAIAAPSIAPPPEPKTITDLTQDEFLEKLNRDLGAWKIAQERKRGSETPPKPAKIRQPQPASALEEEERFYLEPLE